MSKLTYERAKQLYTPYDVDQLCRLCALRDVEIERLRAESAKLRELVRHLRECTRHNVCAACKYAGGVCDFDYDLRELGIEVDE